jgi:hypothetical protein
LASASFEVLLKGEEYGSQTKAKPGGLARLFSSITLWGFDLVLRLPSDFSYFTLTYFEPGASR